MFTEKTLFAILGCTFPIWVGSYGAPDFAKKIGIDIFDDIINHDYQYKSTVTERCYFAIKNNLHLLTNLDQVKILRRERLSRLDQNKQALLEGNIFNRYINEQISKLNKPLQHAVKPFADHYLQSKSSPTNQDPISY
jgi:hypothetical protein